jgi:peroxiredoxin
MNKRLNTIIWVIAVLTVIGAAYSYYAAAKPKSFAAPLQQNTVGDTSGADKQVAPDFSLKDMNGKTVKLSDYRGKIVILNFWAVWCKYCKEEMPDLNALNKELSEGNDAVILAIDVQESRDTVRNYLSSNNISLTVLLDTDGTTAEAYGVSGYPNTFVLNRDGTLYAYIPGATDKATLSNILNKAIKGEPLK